MNWTLPNLYSYKLQIFVDDISLCMSWHVWVIRLPVGPNFTQIKPSKFNANFMVDGIAWNSWSFATTSISAHYLLIGIPYSRQCLIQLLNTWRWINKTYISGDFFVYMLHGTSANKLWTGKCWSLALKLRFQWHPWRILNTMLVIAWSYTQKSHQIYTFYWFIANSLHLSNN